MSIYIVIRLTLLLNAYIIICHFFNKINMLVEIIINFYQFCKYIMLNYKNYDQ